MIPPTPGCTLLVKVSADNQDSTFWRRYVSERAVLARLEPDGLWSVVMHDGNPVEAVRPDRFLVIAPAPPLKRWWQFWRRS